MNKDLSILSGPKDESNIPKESLGKYFMQCLQQRKDPNDIMIIDAVTKATITCGKFLEDSINLSKAFEKLLLTQGDVVSIISENVINYSVPVLAAFYLGVTVNLLNPDYLDGELRHAITITKPKLLICSEKCAQKAIKLQKEFDFIENILLFSYSTTEFQNLNTIEQLIKLNPTPISAFKPREFDYSTQEAMILMSSGTTGKPKGVPLTHENLRPMLVYLSCPNYINIKQDECTVQIVPNFHIYGVSMQMAAITRSIKLVIMSKFNPEVFLKSIEDYKVDRLFLVPTTMNFLVHSHLTEKYNISSIREIMYGASPLSKSLLIEALKKFNPVSIRQGYGLTETGGIVTYQTAPTECTECIGNLVHETLGMVWCPETKQMLGPLKTGELCFKGPSIMKTYVGDKKQMEECVDNNGFFHSGDLGYYDEDRVFYIVGRIKELIKYKGFQVSPTELEALIITHPAVNDCGVIGIPDERAGEIPLAYVVPKLNKKVTEEEIVQFVAERISAQKHLYGGVKFINEIPRNPSGKIMRQQLLKVFKDSN